MEWNVLAVGDVVAGCGVSMIEKHLPQLRRQVKADFTVVNGENEMCIRDRWHPGSPSSLPPGGPPWPHWRQSGLW